MKAHGRPQRPGVTASATPQSSNPSCPPRVTQTHEPLTASWRETHHARHLPRLYDTQRRLQLDVGMVTRNVIIINTAHYTDTAVYMEVPNGVLESKVHVDGFENKMSLPLRNDFWTEGVFTESYHGQAKFTVENRGTASGIPRPSTFYCYGDWYGNSDRSNTD